MWLLYGGYNDHFRWRSFLVLSRVCLCCSLQCLICNHGHWWPNRLLFSSFVNAFEGQIRSIVETAITKKITEGIVKLDSLLQTLPKKINVDKVASLNVTVVNGPLFRNSSVEVDINGLFIPSYDGAVVRYLNRDTQLSDFCDGKLKMLEFSLDEDVFNSGSKAYFKVILTYLFIWQPFEVVDFSTQNLFSSGWIDALAGGQGAWSVSSKYCKLEVFDSQVIQAVPKRWHGAQSYIKLSSSYKSYDEEHWCHHPLWHDCKCPWFWSCGSCCMHISGKLINER